MLVLTAQMERWFPDVSYCHFQSTTGECLPLGKAINFKSLSFVDLWPISLLLPLLPSTCLFWNSKFLFGMLWRGVPLIILPFLLLSPDLCNSLFYLWDKKMYRAVVFLFKELSHIGAYKCCWIPLYTHYFILQDDEISSSKPQKGKNLLFLLHQKG